MTFFVDITSSSSADQLFLVNEAIPYTILINVFLGSEAPDNHPQSLFISILQTSSTL